jgi:hypothetical protein
MDNFNIRAQLQQLQKKRRRIQQEEENEVIVDRVVENPLDPELQQIGGIDNEISAVEDNGLIEFEKIGTGIWHQGLIYNKNSRNNFNL